LSIELHDIPGNWEWKVLDDVLSRFKSGNRPKGGVSDINDGIPSIGGEHLTDDGGFDFSNMKYVPEDFYEDMNQGKIEKGDVLMVKDGATTGKTSFVKDNFPFDKAAINSHVFLFRPTEELNNKYLFYYLYSSFGQNFVNENLSGTTQGGINLSFSDNTYIPLPPLDEQIEIVNKIEESHSKLDFGLDLLEKLKERMNVYKTSILKAAMEGDLTKKWRNENEIRIPESISKISDKNMPKDVDIPKEWKWSTIGDIKKSMRNGIYKPKKFYNDDGIACLRMYNIENGEIVWKDIKRMDLTSEELEKYRLRPGDILINRVNSRKLVGKSAIIPENIETCVFESKNIRLKLNKELIESKFLHYWLQLYTNHYVNNIAKQTVGQATITQKQLSSMPIPYANKVEQRKIIDQIEKNITLISKYLKDINHNVSRAKKVRESILEKAFKGEFTEQFSDLEVNHNLERRKRSNNNLSQKRLDTYVD